MALLAALWLINLAINLWVAWRILRGRFFLFPILGKRYMLKYVQSPKGGAPEIGIAELTSMLDMFGVPLVFGAAFLVCRSFYWNRSKQHDHAIEDAAAAIESGTLTDLWRSRALYARGSAWFQKGEWRRCAADFGLAIDLGQLPTKFQLEMHITRGRCWHWMGELDEALVDFAVVIDNVGATLDQKVMAYVGRGDCRCSQGRYDDAMADYKVVLENPGLQVEKRDAVLLRMARLRHDMGDVVGAVDE
jgi:tetratricopeptide (TPR) repeat protein